MSDERFLEERLRRLAPPTPSRLGRDLGTKPSTVPRRLQLAAAVGFAAMFAGAVALAALDAHKVPHSPPGAASQATVPSSLTGRLEWRFQAPGSAGVPSILRAFDSTGSEVSSLPVTGPPNSREITVSVNGDKLLMPDGTIVSSKGAILGHVNVGGLIHAIFDVEGDGLCTLRAKDRVNSQVGFVDTSGRPSATSFLVPLGPGSRPAFLRACSRARDRIALSDPTGSGVGVFSLGGSPIRRAIPTNGGLYVVDPAVRRWAQVRLSSGGGLHTPVSPVEIRDVETGVLVTTLPPAYPVGFSADGRRISLTTTDTSGADQHVQVVDWASGAVLWRSQAPAAESGPPGLVTGSAAMSLILSIGAPALEVVIPDAGPAHSFSEPAGQLLLPENGWLDPSLAGENPG